MRGGGVDGASAAGAPRAAGAWAAETPAGAAGAFSPCAAGPDAPRVSSAFSTVFRTFRDSCATLAAEGSMRSAGATPTSALALSSAATGPASRANPGLSPRPAFVGMLGAKVAPSTTMASPAAMLACGFGRSGGAPLPALIVSAGTGVSSCASGSASDCWSERISAAKSSRPASRAERSPPPETAAATSAGPRLAATAASPLAADGPAGVRPAMSMNCMGDPESLHGRERHHRPRALPILYHARPRVPANRTRTRI